VNLFTGDLRAFHESYPDEHDGMHWASDAETRYQVMLDLIRPTSDPVSLLDFGCGRSDLLDVIQRHGRTEIRYEGLDLSDRFIAESRSRFPTVPFHQVDVLADDAPSLPEFDYVIMNGIFQYRGELSNERMSAYLQALVRRLFPITRIGLAFNVITKQVEWERDDLFHVAVDPLLTFLSHEISRHILIRHDYGLYELTVYVYREPSGPDGRAVKRLLADQGRESA
jgi:SAM-dependent methyltransferase